MDYEMQFLKAVAATVAVETAVLWAAVRLLPSKDPRPTAARILGAGALCSSATLPWLWFVLPAFVSARGWYLGIGEPAVTVAEGFILAGILPTGWRRGLALSLACNALSWAAGALYL